MFHFFGLILKWPKMVLLVTSLLAFMGWHIVSNLPVDVFPDISVPRIVIQTEAGGLSADEVERLVTIPIESAVNGLPGVTAIRSSSGGGLSFVWIDFDVNTDISTSRFEVFERLSRISETLPSEVRAEIAPVVSVTGEIMIVALTADGQTSDLELRECAEYDLRMRLLAIPGIGEVTVMGGRLPECRIAANPERLVAYGLDINDVIEAAEASSTFSSAGYLPSVAGDELPLRQVANLSRVEDLKLTLLPSAAPLRLGDVAEVSLAGAPRRGSGSFEGKDAVLLSVQKTPGGNTLELTARVEAALDSFEQEFKGTGISVHREAYRQADLINASIAGSKEVLRDAVIVVILVLGLTLLHLRTITVVLITMPFSVLLGMLLFPTLGIGINVMTLGGFAVAAGDIVDASIIFTEVIWRKLRENEGREPITTVIAQAARSVMPGVLSSSLAIFLVFTPLLLLSGLESRFFRPFALSYLAIFAASFIVSIIVVPALSKLLWKDRPHTQTATTHTRESFATRIMKACYRPFVRIAIKVPLLTLLITLAMGIGAGWLATSFGSSFLPPFREDAFNAMLSLPPGASLEETERISEACCEAIRAIPGVLSVTQRTGRAERDQHAEPVSSSEFVVRVNLNADISPIRDEIRAILSAVPGTSAQVGYPIAHRISAILSGTEAELAISVYGEDIATLRTTVARLKTLLDNTPGVADVRADREISIRTLRIDYDLEALAEAGLTLKSAGEQVATAFNGTEVGEMRDGIRRRPIMVRLANPPEGTDEETVKNLLLHAPGGKYVRLRDVAQVVPEEASNLLLRENGRRRALISCNVTAETTTGELVQTLQSTLDPVAQEMGCSIAYGGSHSAREHAAKRLITLSIVLTIALFALLLFVLGNVSTAVVALISVPLGLLGGILAVYLTDGVISVPSLIGFVTVAGFTIRNGILLLSRYRERLENGASLDEAIIEGSAERMVPIIMTSLTTVLGLIPIMTAADKPGGELLAPLAIVQFGGILGALFLGLIVLPAAARLALRGVAKSKATLVIALLCCGLGLTGCQSYTARPIDWEEEQASWQNQSGEVHFHNCEEAALLACIGNIDLNQLRLQALGSQKAAAEVGWWEDPELELDLSRILQAPEHPFILGNALSFSIPLSGVPKLEARAAEGIAEADALEVKSAELEVATAARVAYHALVIAEVKASLLRNHFKNLNYQNMLKTIQQLAAVGEIDAATLVEVQRTHSARSIELGLAERAVCDAQEALRTVTGLAPWVKIRVLSKVITVSYTCDTCPAPCLTMQELSSHLKVKTQLARLGADELALQAEIQRQYPNLTLGPLAEREDGMNKVGLSLGIDLPLWNRNRAAIAEAEASRDVSRGAVIQTWRTLVLEANALHQKRDAMVLHALLIPQDNQDFDTLLEQGELTPVDYLALQEGDLDIRLSKLDWMEQLLTNQAELSKFQID